MNHHHAHLAPPPHHAGAIESPSQLTLLSPDATPISQMVSITGGQLASLSVNTGMMHGLVSTIAQGPPPPMIHTNGSHLYGPGDGPYLSRLTPTTTECSLQHYNQAAHLNPQSLGTPAHVTSNKKRKVSDQDKPVVHNGNVTGTNASTNIYIKQEPNSLSPDSALHGGNNSCTSSNNSSNVHSTQQCEDEYFDYGPDSQMYVDPFYQCIRFTAFNPTSSCPLFDVNFKEMYYTRATLVKSLQ